MKKPKTKAQVREEIEQQIKDYLQQGGQVSQHAQGVSSREAGMHPFKSQPSQRPAETRTPVDDAIAALESRRRAKPPEKHKSRKKPRKILITDDFGQPLRWVWEDEVQK